MAQFSIDENGHCVIPAGTTEIGERAFVRCRNLQSVKIPNGVTSIGTYAFMECDSLKSVEMPDSVTEIGEFAFGGCRSLKSIKIPNGVTTIGDHTFWDCESLQSVEIPDSVTSIGERAFNYCESLRSIVIPGSVTEIGECVFNACHSLQSIEVSQDNECFMSRDNCLLSKDGTRLLFGCKTSVIPDSVTEIGERAFSGCNSLQSIDVSQDNENFMSRDNCLLSKDGTRLLFGCNTSVIPDGVTEVGDHAFSGCRDLQSIDIPSSVARIGDDAFSGCGSLQSIEVSQDNAYFMSRGNCLLSKDGTILLIGCKMSVIPDSVTEIGRFAFSGCRDLHSVDIPSSVTRIGNYAFELCYSLQSVEIPDSVTSIGHSAFLKSKNLSSLILRYKEPNDLLPEIVDRLPISDRITLHVPVGTGDAYRHHPVFSKVKEVIDDVR